MARLEKLGNLIRTKRKEKKLSIEKTAQLANISYSYLNNLENNRRKNVPSVEVLKNIADVLEIPMTELMAATGYLQDDKGSILQDNLNNLGALEIFSKINASTQIKIFDEYIKLSHLPEKDILTYKDIVNNYDLTKGTPLEKIILDAIIIRVRNLLNLFVFAQAINILKSLDIESELLFDLSMQQSDVKSLGELLEFANFEIWYNHYFKDGFLVNFGDYKISYHLEETIEIGKVLTTDTVTIDGRIISPQKLRIIRAILIDD